MFISHLIQKWSSLAPTSKIVIVTDDVQKNIALAIQDEGIYDVQVEYYSQADEFADVIRRSGTDISFQIKPFTTYSHEITEDGGIAFLPPSETSSEVITETAIRYDKIKAVREIFCAASFS